MLMTGYLHRAMKLEHDWFRTATVGQVRTWLAGCDLQVTRRQVGLFKQKGTVMVFLRDPNEVLEEVARFQTIDGLTASAIPYEEAKSFLPSWIGH